MDTPSSNRKTTPKGPRLRRPTKKPLPVSPTLENRPDGSSWGPAVAGPSSAAFTADASPASGVVNGETSDWAAPAHWPGAFERGDDFIAFESLTDENGQSPLPTSTREWDMGKQPNREPPGRHAGVKRQREVDALDRNEGYVSKKNMVNSSLRKAPWAANVEWDKCKNVAQMYYSLSISIRFEA